MKTVKKNTDKLKFVDKESELSALSVDRIPGGLKYVLVTRAGEGPETLEEQDHLLNANGEPKFIN